MLQKNEKYMKKNGKFDIDSLINECFLYASRLLESNKQVKVKILLKKNLIVIIFVFIYIRPNKKISVFRVTGLKIVGGVSTDFNFIFFFLKKYKFMHFERHFAFQNA